MRKDVNNRIISKPIEFAENKPANAFGTNERKSVLNTKAADESGEDSDVEAFCDRSDLAESTKADAARGFNAADPANYNNMSRSISDRKSIIRVRNLRKIYKLGEEKVAALNNINLDIEEGEICCIFGTSGSGKSTFLNMISGMEKPTSGSIKILGKEVVTMSEQTLTSFRQKYIGMIFQSYNLMQGFTAVENTAMPLMFCGMAKKQRERIAEALLKRVGLGERTKHYPNQMSGGQQQRVGIARAYVNRPRLILADEPTGNLDSKTTAEVMQMIVNFSKEFNQTVVIVTHDPEMAKYATRVIHMKDGNVIEDTRNSEVQRLAM